MPVELLQLSDGRSLAYELYGAPHGDPVYFFHGFPGSRLQAGLISDQAQEKGICLVAFDRPGFGQSSRAPARTILSIAHDVEQLADHLGHSRFGLLGASCGGPYALACAVALPERIIHVGLLAGVGPMDVPGIRDSQLLPLKLIFFLAKWHRWLVAPIVALDRLMFRRSPAKAVEALAKFLSPPDQAMLRTKPDISSIFGEGLAEAYRQGISGAMTEARLIALPRGFNTAGVSAPTDLYQGGLDRHVPPTMGKYIADQIPGVRYHFLENEGHLSIMINAFGDYAAQFRTALTS
jgi:pimeloyl-ACP methyl ester carboxylesterase